MGNAKNSEKQTVAVSSRAIIQRINRALKDRDEVLKTARDGSRLEQQVGQYYVLDTRLNAIGQMGVSLPRMARELGVLQPYEHVES